MEEAPRPSPDQLLSRINAEEKRAGRARLRIFFGFAPGVGKTYKMLEAARELQLQDIDLCIGLVETHGRYDTSALLLGLEVLPRRRIEYQGRTLDELDLDAVLARRPHLVLIDELAHTNVPGSRHPKRWQDVFELLDAGIDVFTTLNVQHVESLNDVVAQITGVRVRETVPDEVLDRADEIELVDVSPEELLARLRDGKVYLPDAATRAAQNFFRRGNLLALRDLALRRTVERVDADVAAYRAENAIRHTWQTAERIMVCIGAAPASAKLIRAARRMAAGLRAPWSAIYVEPLGRPPLGAADEQRLQAHMRLVESLGGELVRVSATGVVDAILAHARDRNVTRIIIGKPTHSRVRDLFRGSLLDAVVRGSGDIDIHVIAGDDVSQKSPPPAPVLRPPVSPRAYAWAASSVLITTALVYWARTFVPLPDVAMLFLVVILAVAYQGGRGPSVLASALSVACFDFFFVPPELTFVVSDARHLFTFATMFGAGLLVSDLVARLRRQEQGSAERARQNALLLGLSRDLSASVDELSALVVLTRHVSQLFDCGAAAFVPSDQGGELELAARTALGADEANDKAVVQWSYDHNQVAGRGTDTLPGSRLHCTPIVAVERAGKPVAVLALAIADAARLDRERELLESCVRLGALAIERAVLVEEKKRAVLKARTEEMRSSLLSAVSHDLRTPLGVITGAATTLRDKPAALAVEQQRELLETICDESERLERLLGNLLDMTRLDSQSVELQREWVPLDELVGSALGRLETRLGARPIDIAIGDGKLLLVSVDPVLFEQLLVNLLDNAAKYTPAGSPLSIAAARVRSTVELTIADRGPGVPTGDEKRVFEKFYRGKRNDPTASGVGLGLAICKAIAEAHGGELTVTNRDGGGALFTIRLPQDTPPATIDAPS